LGVVGQLAAGVHECERRRGRILVAVVELDADANQAWEDIPKVVGDPRGILVLDSALLRVPWVDDLHHLDPDSSPALA
jgi:hypothetical protein